MIIFNEKPLSEIRKGETENLPPAILQVYEIIAAMGEEQEQTKAELQKVKEELAQLKQ